MHIYFAASGQRGGSLRKLHVDFKALGGFVLVPPSQIGGKRYHVIDERPWTGATLDWAACKRLLVRLSRTGPRGPGAALRGTSSGGTRAS